MGSQSVKSHQQKQIQVYQFAYMFFWISLEKKPTQPQHGAGPHLMRGKRSAINSSNGVTLQQDLLR